MTDLGVVAGVLDSVFRWIVPRRLDLVSRCSSPQRIYPILFPSILEKGRTIKLPDQTLKS
jgi:hypothetical protein